MLAGLWIAIFFFSLFSPPLSGYAGIHLAGNGGNASPFLQSRLAQSLLAPAPLAGWLIRLSIRIFGLNSFAVLLPQALAVALLALLGHRWANQAFGARTAFYTSIALLTSLGVFLFTRAAAPEVLLALTLAAALFAFLKCLGPISSEPDVNAILSQAALSPENNPEHTAEDLEDRSVILSETRRGPENTAQDRSVILRAARSAQSKDLHSGPATNPVILSGGAPAPQSKDPDELHPASSARTVSPHPPAAQTAPPTHLLRERPSLIPSAGPLYPYVMWASLALAVLSSGVLALVFFLATVAGYLLLLGETGASLRKLKPLTGILLFLLIAAPWYLFAAPQGLLPIPTSTHRPDILFWALHLLWLFPWSLFLPLGMAALWRRFRHQTGTLTRDANLLPPFQFLVVLVLIATAALFTGAGLLTSSLVTLAAYALIMIAAQRRQTGFTASPFHRIDPQQRTILLLSLFAAIILLFFSIAPSSDSASLPAYLPVLLLIASTLSRAEQAYSSDASARRTINAAHATFAVLGAATALALCFALFASRHLPFQPSAVASLAHRGLAPASPTLSKILDLTPAAFAALRLPSVLAILALLLGPHLAWLLRTQRRHLAATTAIAFTSAVFLIAAHAALIRFAALL